MDNEKTIASCGCAAGIVIVNALVGGWAVNVLLTTFLGKALPFGWAMVIGLFTGEITIPAGIVVAILHMFHIL